MLDADGKSLAADVAIRGFQFDCENVDSVHSPAVMMVPESAALAIRELGGLLIPRHRW